MRILRYVYLVLILLAVGCDSASKRDYLFVLRSTDGLRRDAAITFLGVKVGYISDLRISSDSQSVTATGRITDSNMRLLQGDAARIVLPGLLAQPQIEITRTNGPETEMPVGSTISVSPLPTVNLSPEQQKAVAETIGGVIQVLTNGATPIKNRK